MPNYAPPPPYPGGHYPNATSYSVFKTELLEKHSSMSHFDPNH
jgi:hypothetical protein